MGANLVPNASLPRRFGLAFGAVFADVRVGEQRQVVHTDVRAFGLLRADVRVASALAMLLPILGAHVLNGTIGAVRTRRTTVSEQYAVEKLVVIAPHHRAPGRVCVRTVSDGNLVASRAKLARLRALVVRECGHAAPNVAVPGYRSRRGGVMGGGRGTFLVSRHAKTRRGDTCVHVVCSRSTCECKVRVS